MCFSHHNDHLIAKSSMNQSTIAKDFMIDLLIEFFDEMHDVEEVGSEDQLAKLRSCIFLCVYPVKY